MDIQSCIARTSLPDLKIIAQVCSLGMETEGTADNLRASLNRSLLDPECVHRLIDHLAPFERQILHHVFLEEGRIPAEDLRRIWGGDDPEAGQRRMYGRNIPPGIATLRLSGLLFCVRDLSNDQELYVIPDSIRKLIEYPSPEFKPHLIPPYTNARHDMGILSDMFSLVRYMTQACVRPLRSGLLPQRHLQVLTDRVLNHHAAIDPADASGYVRLIYLLAFKLDLLAVRTSRIIPGDRFESWISQSPIQQLRLLCDAWLDDREYDEFHSLSAAIVLSAGLRQSSRIVRLHLFRTLALYPPAEWIPHEHLDIYTRKIFPFFFRPLPGDHHWKLRNTVSQETVVTASWENLESRVIRHFLTGPFYWLGLVSIGFGMDRQPYGYMLTPAGDAVIHRRDSALIQDPFILNRITIQPDFEMLVPKTTVLRVRFGIETLADLVSDGAVSRYKLTRSKICNALDQGMTGDSIVSFLKSISGNPVPQNIEASIRSWSDNYGRLEVSQRCILEADNEFTFQEALNRINRNEILEKLLGDRSAAVRKGQAAALISELRRIGMYPKVDPSIRGNRETGSQIIMITPELAKTLLELLRTRRSTAVFDAAVTRELKEFLSRLEELIQSDERTE